MREIDDGLRLERHSRRRSQKTSPRSPKDIDHLNYFRFGNFADRCKLFDGSWPPNPAIIGERVCERFEHFLRDYAIAIRSGLFIRLFCM